MKYRKKDLPMNFGAGSTVFCNAKCLRKSMTNAESYLWLKLRNRRFHGIKFRRQHPIGRYIADFYCHECLLVIEIDGSIHIDPTVKERDQGRTFELEAKGIRVIRFTNDQVMEDITGVLKEIENATRNMSSKYRTPHVL